MGCLAKKKVSVIRVRGERSFLSKVARESFWSSDLSQPTFVGLEGLHVQSWGRGYLQVEGTA